MNQYSILHTRQLKRIAEEICKKRNIALEWNLIQQTKPVACDEVMNKLMEQSIQDAGYEVVELVSGAGHDAVPVSEVSPVVDVVCKMF